MSPLVTTLVLGAALLHANWNAVVKSSRDVMRDTALVAAGAGVLSLPLIAVAALRETSVIFAALLGTILLKEPFGRRRVIGACTVALGVIALRV
jgi:uncharacterized membrane protein